MLARQLLFGLIVGIFVCHPQETFGQIIRNVPKHGSVSKAKSNAYEKNVDFGALELNRGVSNSRSVTKSNGGVRNGGTTSVTNSNAQTQGVNIGGLDIGSTLTRTQSRTNGQVSRGIAHDVNVGNLGFGSSLSRDNLKNGFGLQRSADGGVTLGLGLLNLDFTNNAQQNNAATNAQAQAQGKNARARAGGSSQTNTQQFGHIGVTETRSNSNAASRTKFGQTSANTAGFGGGAGTQAGTAYQRPRRTSNSQLTRRRRVAPAAPVVKRRIVRSRPKRQVQFIPFEYAEVENRRVRRQFGRPGGFQQPYYGGYQQPVWSARPINQNANAQGIANNKGNGFQQQAGTNSHSNNQFNQNGFFQDNGASSIGSNIANDGTRGQVSSANVAQMNMKTKEGSSSTNNAQSQALNFDPNMQQAASSNAGTEHIRDQNSEKIKANSGSQVTNNNKFGTSTNIANTNSAVVREGNTQTSSSDASSQSIFQGANGQNSAANTNSQTSSVQRPGFVSNSATSNASSTSNGGKGANANAVASASSSSGFGAGGGFSNTNSQAGAGGGWQNNGGAQANSGTSLNQFARGRAVYQSRPHTKTQQLQMRQFRSYPPLFISTASSSILINRQNGTASKQLPAALHQRKRERFDLRQPDYRQMSRLPMRNHDSTPITDTGNEHDNGDQLAVMSINRTTEQFGAIDENERQGRTFQFITDFINSLTGCVYPCTIDAFQNNRCCVFYPPPPPPPPPCCLPPPIRPPILPPPLPPPMPPPIPPPRPPLPPPIPPFPPINCCVRCFGFGFYGPPPCYGFGGYGGGFGFGGGIGVGPQIDSFNNYPLGFGRTSAALQRNPGSGGTHVTIYVPPPSTVYISAEDM